MASLPSSSSGRSSSSSSYRSSARYCSSSSFRSEGSCGGPADPLDPLFEPLDPLFEPLLDPLDPLFEPFLDPAGPRSLFGEEGDVAPLGLPAFSPPHRRESYGYQGPPGGAGTGRPASMGAVRSLGDSYYMSADVGQFEPQDIVVMAYNHHIVIHAEKVLDDGSVSNTFTHKSLLPEDMDPLSVGGTLTPEGMLVVGVRRRPPAPPAYRSEAHL